MIDPRCNGTLLMSQRTGFEFPLCVVCKRCGTLHPSIMSDGRPDRRQFGVLLVPTGPATAAPAPAIV